MLTTVPNYRLWVDEVNKAGGLMLKKYNKRIPIEVIEIDDRSNNEDMVRLVERLMTVDKVDIVLSPWGTGPNLQAAPDIRQVRLPADHGHGRQRQARRAGAEISHHVLVPGQAQRAGQGAGRTCWRTRRARARSTTRLRVFVVQHPFGVEYSASLKPALAGAGFKVVYETSYALGVCRSLRPDQGGQGGQARTA